MSAREFLERLRGVKQTGPARWLARCPSHDDKRPSLSVRELPDGRVLAHCFGGCGIDDVLGSVGLEMQALFTEKLLTSDNSRVPRIPAADILRAVAHEIEVVAIGANEIDGGPGLNEVDRARFRLAIERLRKAATVANGH